MAATGSKSKGRKGKLGKNKHRIVVYYNSGRHYWNKARDVVRHAKANPADKAATEALKVRLAAMPLGMQREFSKLYSV